MSDEDEEAKARWWKEVNDPSRYRIAEKPPAEAEAQSDLDEAVRKLENIHDIIVDVGSRIVAPVPGMGVVVKEVVNFLEDFATLGLRHRNEDDKTDD